MSDLILRAENIGKRYTLNHQSSGVRYRKFSDVLVHAAKAPLRWMRTANREPRTANSKEDFWALKDVSFEIKQGEVVGIIGRNGAGKSTLLKVLSRITEPTTGKITINGRIASLLEVGTGFHPELTGRENVFLNGAILGMRKDEIKAKFDEIVAFAEVEKFLDTPVKRYSSGMYVRLAFAVAAHLEPEILIIDEVLAVGDAEFQKKCLGKMTEVSSGGRTILFVSHNMAAVRTLCSRSLMLVNGQLMFDGTTTEAIERYSVQKNETEDALSWQRKPSECKPPLAFTRISIEITGEQPQLRLQCAFEIACLEPSGLAFLAVDILDQSQLPLMQAIPNSTPFIGGEPGTHHLKVEIDLPPLIPGIYLASFWIGPHYTTTFDHLKELLKFEVTESPTRDRTFPHSTASGALVPLSRVQSSSRNAEI